MPKLRGYPLTTGMRATALTTRTWNLYAVVKPQPFMKKLCALLHTSKSTEHWLIWEFGYRYLLPIQSIWTLNTWASSVRSPLNISTSTMVEIIACYFTHWKIIYHKAWSVEYVPFSKRFTGWCLWIIVGTSSFSMVLVFGGPRNFQRAAGTLTTKCKTRDTVISHTKELIHFRVSANVNQCFYYQVVNGGFLVL